METFKFWGPVLVWMGVIFGFSSLRVHPASEVYWQDFVVKKFAHVVEYSILFMLIYRALLNTTALSRVNAAKVALLAVFLYAVSDEFHQSFTPGREPKLRDVLIDTFAGILTWGLIWKYLPKAPAKLKGLAKSLQII